ncbi:spore coat protein [Bacillus sp. 31A1R]|uniref:Spore coat protein n=1 Tax=Robertmurraya mangrovi TaxID=3098077 RepID=A0ABU5IYG2_9BACI|nr:spore coat protein [Bacillus sp. 31A1R]MDZ5472176.1 spore coat protein [Bacillus sp. 31A1R]
MLSGRGHCGTRGDVLGTTGGKRWDALDPESVFPITTDDDVRQEGNQVNDIEQRSSEYIVIRNSLDVRVTSTETQVAASLQAAIQAAIALVINLSIADGDQAEAVTQELLQYTQIQQVNRQKIYIENSRQVRVETTDTDVAVSLQLMIQLLLALLVEIDIL